MIGTHAIPADEYAALATGAGGPVTIGRLRSSQLSKNIVLLRAIMQTADDSYPDAFAEARFAEGYALLEAAQRIAPDVVADVLLHPQVGAWAGLCLRRLLNVSTVDEPVATQLGYLAAVGAAAATRAGHPFAVTVPTVDGRIVLPTLGRFELPTGGGSGTAVVRLDGDRLTATATPAGTVVAPADLTAPAPGWSPLRRISAQADGLSITLDVDDLGPYRAGGQMNVAERVDDEVVARYADLLDEAWHLLVTLFRDRAEGMAIGLRTLVPMVDDRAAPSQSATSRDAFGAVMLTVPDHPMRFAETLVHEFQHSKLDAVLDLLPLYGANDSELFYSPARDDPRPLGGMLQGAYAYAGVADFWRRIRTVRPTGYAQSEFASWREQVERVCLALIDSGRLTTCGLDLVSGMLAQMRLWGAEEITPGQRAAGREAADDHHVRWLLNNVHPDPDLTATLATAWLADEPGPGVAYVAPPPRPCPQVIRHNPRLWLRQTRDSEPDRFALMCADPRAFEETADASAGDLAYLRDDHATAVDLYRAHILDEPENVEHWAGLLLARRRLHDDDATGALRHRPELVRAVHLAVLRATGTAPDPVALAAWLAPEPAPEPMAEPATAARG